MEIVTTLNIVWGNILPNICFIFIREDIFSLFYCYYRITFALFHTVLTVFSAYDLIFVYYLIVNFIHFNSQSVLICFSYLIVKIHTYFERHALVKQNIIWAHRAPLTIKQRPVWGKSNILQNNTNKHPLRYNLIIKAFRNGSNRQMKSKLLRLGTVSLYCYY